MPVSARTWQLLQREHDRMRQLLTAMQRLAREGEWRTSQHSRDALEGLIVALHSFDQEAHRPKGVALLAALRRRTVGADRLLLQDLEAEQRQCEALLQRIRTLLASAPLSELDAATCAELLAQHDAQRLAHLAREDTALRECAERSLTADDWAAVASAIARHDDAQR